MSEDVEMELELLEAAYGPDFALLRENSCEVKLNKDFTVRLIFPESYPASIFVADFRSGRSGGYRPSYDVKLNSAS